MADGEPELETIAKEHVVTKYKTSSKFVNAILKELIEKCVQGAFVLDLCMYGDARLQEETDKVYNKEKDLKKGIAFPTCISINNCICHFSPLKSEPAVELQDGDIVKIDLGAHIDGFAAVAAHTLVVGASREKPVTGRKADVMLAAHFATEAAMRLVTAGTENYTITDTLGKLVREFKCKPVEGMLSHQLEQHKIDGEKAIILNPNDSQRKEHAKCEFDVHEVYAIDVLVSTGEGKAKDLDTRTTVYKRKGDVVYNLKMKSSRQFFSEAERRFCAMPFTLRAFESEAKAKMGVIECINHNIMDPFPVLYENRNELVAQFKYTVLLFPDGPRRITSSPVDIRMYQSEYKVEDPDLLKILATPIITKSSNRRRKKAAEAAQAEAAAAAES